VGHENSESPAEDNRHARLGAERKQRQLVKGAAASYPESVVRETRSMPALHDAICVCL
jgi:hypothetical protein